MKRVYVSELNPNDVIISGNERWVVRSVRQISEDGYRVHFYGGWYTEYFILSEIFIEV